MIELLAEKQHVSNTGNIVIQPLCLHLQDTGGIDWGDSGTTPIEIEVVETGTDCNYSITT